MAIGRTVHGCSSWPLLVAFFPGPGPETAVFIASAFPRSGTHWTLERQFQYSHGVPMVTSRDCIHISTVQNSSYHFHSLDTYAHGGKPGRLIGESTAEYIQAAVAKLAAGRRRLDRVEHLHVVAGINPTCNFPGDQHNVRMNPCLVGTI